MNKNYLKSDQDFNNISWLIINILADVLRLIMNKFNWN